MLNIYPSLCARKGPQLVTELVYVASVLTEFLQMNKLPESGVVHTAIPVLGGRHRRIRSSRTALATFVSVQTNSKLNQQASKMTALSSVMSIKWSRFLPCVWDYKMFLINVS